MCTVFAVVCMVLAVLCMVFADFLHGFCHFFYGFAVFVNGLCRFVNGFAAFLWFLLLEDGQIRSEGRFSPETVQSCNIIVHDCTLRYPPQKKKTTSPHSHHNNNTGVYQSLGRHYTRLCKHAAKYHIDQRWAANTLAAVLQTTENTARNFCNAAMLRENTQQ